MEKNLVIEDLCSQLEHLARLHITHDLYNTQAFRSSKSDIENYIRTHEIDPRQELDVGYLNLYKRYFA